MLKDFFKWHSEKEKIHNRESGVYFYEREIWWASLGLNIGYEEDGKNEKFERPILVLKKFNKYILWALPLTSKNKESKYYYPFEFKGEKYSVILSQLRIISSKRLLRKLGQMPEDDFSKIRESIRKLV
ncbi:hypothetical protein A2333_01230 [Candidatus Wolfebacteria bacterium RIFOXYB2_FULL_49_7]|uniref:2,4-dihydroxyhept-2-ene-1,7-dioic acid aldolase n=1 Tax=Candidatus Wolfebacteria bacterium RIFOXYB1_FULL_54_12 TaxID=1802559 RepID=A0A1F8DW67_9BACT|nr:MAG: hypothetical protein A2372_00925 [Candidatus Wolfebacteria bacterium RIFOXYB1_FULL_54_12]OGM94730.1 MAG: hypothetical protein A2524_02460 [Candidatus Wolfebacteria bacterium RIFOXYD12_FULL_48_21]OGM95712.1 MAG: hypothetical protein A2532_03650 [Candidatus Wolfebacteria bacterium RIFOXYD2_FULL_48_11]OGM96477.1 MAG: hypothetical protein A2333_01230 [Candidatus Wolfebacteria bacterium RIFOXYB2_FULL_49_7]